MAMLHHTRRGGLDHTRRSGRMSIDDMIEPQLASNRESKGIVHTFIDRTPRACSLDFK